MRNSPQEYGYCTSRALIAFVLFVSSISLGVLSVAGTPRKTEKVNPIERGPLLREASVAPAKIGVAANSGPSWSVVSSPNTNDGPLSNDFNAVACNSSVDCWAVGHRDPYNGAIQTLIEHWDGNSWSIVPSPNTRSDQDNLLNGAECNSASDCWAVGYYVNDSDAEQTLIEHWDGVSWSIVGSPNGNASSNLLEAVTCVSASNCWAVGFYRNGSLDQALIERWDGNSWQLVTSPDTIAPSDKYLYGITCPSASQCWAVGNSYGAAGVDQTLIEQWDGNSWTIAVSPNANATSDNDLRSVTCTSVSDCWAVGSYINNRYQTLIEHWNGVAWIVTQSPNTSTTVDNFLYGVTCVSTSGCWAVGAFNYSHTLVQKWDGSNWSIATAPDSGVLIGVTCNLATDCWAVGSGIRGGAAQTLTEHWNGTAWSTISSPNINTGFRPNGLSAVTCLTAADCWVVGTHNEANNVGDTPQTLTGHWDGAQWTVIPSANDPSTGMGLLEGVNCVGANDCWAVGYVGDYISTRVIVEHWTGGPQWMLVSAPNADVTQNRLYSVACISASDCWAVGDSNPLNNGTSWKPLIEHWNGVSWTIAPSPTTGKGDHLTAVMCLASDNCWAVGWTLSLTANNDRSLIEHWNGTTWAIVSSPNSSNTEDNHLESVACISAGDCWAVGQTEASGATDRTLIQHWDGSAWSVVASPNTNTFWNALHSVACSSSSNCWSVGEHYGTSGGGYETLIEHWNGVIWGIVSSPSPIGGGFNELYGVACASADSLLGSRVAISRTWRCGLSNANRNVFSDYSTVT